MSDQILPRHAFDGLGGIGIREVASRNGLPRPYKTLLNAIIFKFIRRPSENIREGTFQKLQSDDVSGFWGIAGQPLKSIDGGGPRFGGLVKIREIDHHPCKNGVNNVS